MVEGVMVYGTFVTKKALTIIAMLTTVVLIFGCILLGIGMSKQCYFPYFHDICYSNKLSLNIDGGVLMGFSVIILVIVSIVTCRVQKAPVGQAPPIIVTHPHVVPRQAVAIPQTPMVYNQDNQRYPQQHLPTAATSETASTSHHHHHHQPTTSLNPYNEADYPQKNPSENATTTYLPPTTATDLPPTTTMNLPSATTTNLPPTTTIDLPPTSSL